MSYQSHRNEHLQNSGCSFPRLWRALSDLEANIFINTWAIFKRKSEELLCRVSAVSLYHECLCGRKVPRGVDGLENIASYHIWSRQGTQPREWIAPSKLLTSSRVERYETLLPTICPLQQQTNLLSSETLKFCERILCSIYRLSFSRNKPISNIRLSFVDSVR